MSLKNIRTILRKNGVHDEPAMHKTPTMSAVLSVPIGTALGFAVQSREGSRGCFPLRTTNRLRVCISAPSGGK